MNFQSLALKKGKEVASRHGQHGLPLTHHSVANGRVASFSTVQNPSNASKAQRARQHVRDLADKHKVQKQARALDKDFFLSVLHASTTKREAKSYIQRFDPAKDDLFASKPSAITSTASKATVDHGVNLGGFYGPAAVQRSPKFVQQPHKPRQEIRSPQIHVALVKLRDTEQLDDRTLEGIGSTLSQLERLGLLSIVVVDCEGDASSRKDVGRLRDTLQKQAERIVTSIEAGGSTQARIVDNVVGAIPFTGSSGSTSYKTQITFSDMLLNPLRKGIIAVIPSFGYTDVQMITKISSSEIIEALTRQLAGLTAAQQLDDSSPTHERHEHLRDEVSLDKLIILDPSGGIPCSKRDSGYHVFLNMEQEFETAKQDLKMCSRASNISNGSLSTGKLRISSPGLEASLSEHSGHMHKESLVSSTDSEPKVDSQLDLNTYYHLENLELARAFLSMLPPSSSVLITSPDEAANLGKDVPFQAVNVGTRRQRNPLIHNLLTDRPAFSSSLPVGRLGGHTLPNDGTKPSCITTPTTIAKHGMSVTVFPDLENGPWQPPTSIQGRLSLTDPQIDLARLVHLIEDSFGRKLDVSEYLKRVNDRIAGIIIAGEYEGGALLTWEMPPGVVDDGSPESRARMVPYLDKFAVLRKRQGSATADLVFKAMVRDCFPNGVCWRSRKDNVVNKWYFERSRGTWKLPDTGWTMFWTTPDLSMDNQTFLDYQSVCRSIQPSWADGKAILD